MRLFTRWRNSAGERVRIALNLKKIAYDYVSVGSLSRDEYLAINPQGLMPALEVDGRVFAQSAAILAFLEEAFPRPALLPTDPLLRAEARAFVAHIAAEMHAITVKRVRAYLIDDFGLGEDGAARWAAHWHGIALTALEAALARRARRTGPSASAIRPAGPICTWCRSSPPRAGWVSTSRPIAGCWRWRRIAWNSTPFRGRGPRHSPISRPARAERGCGAPVPAPHGACYCAPCTSPNTTARTILAFSTR